MSENNTTIERAGFAAKWTSSNGPAEDLLIEYHEREGGLMCRGFNPCYQPRGSETRRVTVRVINPPERYDGERIRYTSDERDQIRGLVADHPTESIEVLPWGFGAFGRTYGKADAIEKGFSDPVDICPVLLLNNPEPEADKVTYLPDESRDHAIHDVFNRHDVKVEVPELW
jgi:hypothetical protein